MASLYLADLHPLFQTVSHKEAIAIADLGAQTYLAAKDRLIDVWTTQQSAEEAEKAEAWRQEGSKSMLESLRPRLSAGEVAANRVSVLQASVDAEANRRFAEAIEGYRKDFELAKMKEISALKERIAMAEGREAMIMMVSEGNAIMKEKIAILEGQLALQLAANTKSSSAIGKQGETIVLELLENTICKQYPHSVVKDMTGVPHAADFHLWMMGASGQKIKMLIDSKKYKRAVNSEEINKLYQDMDVDEECQCGILISIDSGICTKRQFCFSRTLKQKPVLFLSFQDLSIESQQDILCWGIQVLTEFVGETDDPARQEKFNKMDEFLDTMLVSVKDIDLAIRAQLKVVDSMKEVRGKIMRGVGVFRGQEEEETKPALAEDLRCIALKADGNRCLNRRGAGSDCCKTHKK